MKQKWKKKTKKKSERNWNIDIFENQVIQLKSHLKQVNNKISELIIKIISVEEKEFNHDSANQGYVSKEETLSDCLTSKKQIFKCEQSNFTYDTTISLILKDNMIYKNFF